MAKKKRAPLSPLTVIGELLLLGGLGVLGYIVWQPWYASLVLGGNQTTLSAEHSAQWSEEEASTDELPVPEVGDNGDIFGVLYVPALGKDFSNVVAEGVGRPEPLDNWDSGVGHYPTTAKPGEVGNFALAAHRNGVLAPFRDVEYLRVGDPIYFETKDGWYTYTFRTQEVVGADAIEVLNPYPYVSGAIGDDSILTLTSCHPKDGAALRIISFAVFDGFTPRADGPPTELAAVNSHVGQEA
ncbi:MAG: class E sortase [Canibacter sp.]